MFYVQMNQISLLHQGNGAAGLSFGGAVANHRAGHLDVMTVTGKTLGENLEELKTNGFYERCQKWLDEA